MNKSISVVMCTYNGARYVRQQLDSILAQTYPATEIIVQDDCSTDGTFDILREYAARYPQIHPIRNEHQLGINPNFYSAMQRATGDFIATSDQDDIWEPNKLELQVNVIGDRLLCAGKTIPFSDDGTEINTDIRTPNYSLFRYCYVGCLAGHTFLFPPKLLALTPLKNTPPRCWDAHLAIVALSYDSVVYVDKKLVNQRRYIGAATYGKPINNRFTLKNIFGTSFHALSLYRELKPELRERGLAHYQLLSQIKSDKPILKEALYMMKLQSQGSFLSLVKLSLFCYKHQTELFYVRTRRDFLNGLRALYYPVFVSIYLRHLSKK